MSNRHERRRAAKVAVLEQRTMSVDEVSKMPSGCGWAGCRATTLDPDAAGWSKLLLYKGPTEANFLDIDPPLMARDCVLCPDHAKNLDENILRDIGNALREVAGNA